MEDEQRTTDEQIYLQFINFSEDKLIKLMSVLDDDFIKLKEIIQKRIENYLNE